MKSAAWNAATRLKWGGLRKAGSRPMLSLQFSPLRFPCRFQAVPRHLILSLLAAISKVNNLLYDVAACEKQMRGQEECRCRSRGSGA